jgi:hypothetical protein
MFLSDDEIPSLPILENLYYDVEDLIRGDKEAIFYPFINIREYTPYWSLHDKEMLMRGYIDREIGKEVGVETTIEWTAVRLFINNGVIKFIGTAHNGMTGLTQGKHIIYPYSIWHNKRFDGNIVTNIWQCMVDDYYRFDTSIKEELLSALKDSGIENNSDSIREHFRSGDISQSLKDWMWKNKDSEFQYLFSWFIYYYFRWHPEELPEDFSDDRLLFAWKDHVLGNSTGVATINTALHPTLKKIFIKRGMLVLSKGLNQ